MITFITLDNELNQGLKMGIFKKEKVMSLENHAGWIILIILMLGLTQFAQVEVKIMRNILEIATAEEEASKAKVMYETLTKGDVVLNQYKLKDKEGLTKIVHDYESVKNQKTQEFKKNNSEQKRYLLITISLIGLVLLFVLVCGLLPSYKNYKLSKSNKSTNIPIS